MSSSFTWFTLHLKTFSKRSRFELGIELIKCTWFFVLYIFKTPYSKCSKNGRLKSILDTNVDSGHSWFEYLCWPIRFLLFDYYFIFIYKSRQWVKCPKTRCFEMSKIGHVQFSDIDCILEVIKRIFVFCQTRFWMKNENRIPHWLKEKLFYTLTFELKVCTTKLMAKLKTG